MKPLHLGIVGASSLKGKELKEALEDTHFALSDIALLDDEIALGKLEAVGDEATFIQAINDETLEDLDLAFFTGDSALTRKHYQVARRANCSIIDTSYALEGEPGFPVRSPWLEEQLGAPPPLDAAGAVVAHPVATALAMILLRLGSVAKLRTAAATILQPASETGHAGMDELHQQTINLLNFTPLPKEVFDTQVAFNLVAHYGAGKAVPLERVQKRIQSHIAAIAPTVLRPAVMVVGAPAFHAHTFSLYIELESANNAAQLAAALNAPHLHVILPDAEPQDQPSNLNSAGEARIALSVRAASARKDNPAFWIWAAADNFKLTALTAIDCARKILDMRPTGQVQ
ncbi:MAG: Asd/ArgC dimerization domain-containing protein [Acidobacteriaceae bacterium]